MHRPRAALAAGSARAAIEPREIRSAQLREGRQVERLDLRFGARVGMAIAPFVVAVEDPANLLRASSAGSVTLMLWRWPR